MLSSLVSITLEHTSFATCFLKFFSFSIILVYTSEFQEFLSCFLLDPDISYRRSATSATFRIPIPAILGLKVVFDTFLLVCFVCLKERTCETRKNVFYFTSKALFVHETIKCSDIQISWRHQMPTHETRNPFYWE